MSKIIGVTVGTTQKPSDFANSLKGSASGNPIVFSDVSPIQHEIKVKLKGVEPIFKSVYYDAENAYEIGKYEFDGDGEYIVSEYEYYPDGDGKCFTFTDGSWMIEADNVPADTEKIYVKDGEPYYISNADEVVDVSGRAVQKYGKNLLPITREISFPADANFSVNCNIKAPFMTTVLIDVTKGATTPAAAFIQYTYSDGTVTYYTGAGWNLNKESGILKRTALIDNGKTLVKVTYLNWCNLEGTIKEMQIEAGKTATEFETYVEPKTYTADENGIVKGVTSLYPTTTLTAEDGVTMEAEYNRDINKAFAELLSKIGG